MRMHKQFSRWKGGAQPPTIPILLGADTSPPLLQPNVSQDNVLGVRFRDPIGWPVHRVAISYKGPNAAIPLIGNLWIWDGETEAWYQIGVVNQPLPPLAITFFDFLGIAEFQATSADLGKSSGTAADVMLIVTDPGGAPAGAHIFGMSPDLTTVGYP